MRKRILEILRKNTSEAVSGEEISNILGVSRTAIWKHIQALKNEGYEIESVAKKGYVLKSVTNKMRPEEIAAKLKSKYFGHKVYYLDSVKSTNEFAKTIAGENFENGTIVVAEEQTGGKGRLSRGWYSPHSHGIWFSVMLKPPFLPQEASKCTLLAAVAVVKAINKYKGVNAVIKWPNDILLNGKKLVGILTEMSAEFGKINYVIIGTGINVSVPKEILSEELKPLSVSIADCAKEKIDRVDLLTDILKNMEDLYEIAIKDSFQPILEEWKKYTNTLNQEVKVLAPDETYYGKAIDIDEDGLLVVKKEDGTVVKVLAGDVSVRPATAEGRNYQ